MFILCTYIALWRKVDRMKSTKKGVLQLLLIIIVIGALGVFLFLGYSDENIKGVKDIGLGLDLAGGLSITYETTDPSPEKDQMEMTIYRMQLHHPNIRTIHLSNRCNLQIQVM